MEPDKLTLVDENGNDLDLSIIEVFTLNDKQYAILMSPLDSETNGTEVYVLRMDTSAEGAVEFVVPDEADMPEVVEEASKILNEHGSFGCGGGCSGCGGHH